MGGGANSSGSSACPPSSDSRAGVEELLLSMTTLPDPTTVVWAKCREAVPSSDLEE